MKGNHAHHRYDALARHLNQSRTAPDTCSAKDGLATTMTVLHHTGNRHDSNWNQSISLIGGDCAPYAHRGLKSAHNMTKHSNREMVCGRSIACGSDQSGGNGGLDASAA